MRQKGLNDSARSQGRAETSVGVDLRTRQHLTLMDYEGMTEEARETRREFLIDLIQAFNDELTLCWQTLGREIE